MLLAGPCRARDLVAFHARHKLQLLAHDPARCRQAGRVTAEAGAAPWEVTAAAYRDVFAAISATVTRGRNTNALLHAFSSIRRELDLARRDDLLARIGAYWRGEIPLSVPVALLAHHASGGSLSWLADQTYLAPFPAALRLRHRV